MLKVSLSNLFNINMEFICPFIYRNLQEKNIMFKSKT